MRLGIAVIWLLAASMATAAEDVLDIKKGMNIYGSSELPKGLTIVPWKLQPPDEAVEALRPAVLDEIFQPLEREVLRRQLRYYHQLFSGDNQHAIPEGAQ